MKEETISITNKTNGKLPRLPFVRIKSAILGETYSLSVALVTPRESHKLNLTYRQKDKPTNVLSFPLDKKSGELVLDLTTSRRDAKNFDMTAEKFLVFLVIHGMLHLKGMDHGSTMEKAEQKFLKMFS
jgi:probable rRNA maturation factor